MVWSLGLGRPLRPGGLGAFFATSARPVWATIVALLFLSGAFFLGAPLPELMLGLSVGGLVATGVGLFLAERFQGLSGDGHGAVGLAAETGLLCALALSNLAGV